MPGALFTPAEMHLHADELHSRQCIIYECKMSFPEFTTVHDPRFEGSFTSTHLSDTGSRTL